jgi:HK97 gp10 family phage protein
MVTFQVFTDDTARKFRNAPHIAVRLSADQVKAATRRITGRAKALVPVLTGKLHDAIDYEVFAIPGYAVGLIGITGGPPAIYWRFVEFGTRHSPAHPYFLPAAMAEHAPFINGMRGWGSTFEREVAQS